MPRASATAGAKALRLMCGDLEAADARRVGAFLAIGSARLRHAWNLVNDGPANVLLSALDCPPTIPGLLDEPVVHIQVCAPAAGRPPPEGALGSPLQFDDFIDALVQAEVRIGAALRRPAAPSTAAPPPAAPPPAAPDSPAVAAAPAPTQAQWDGLRFRLRRWPSAKLLAQSRYGVRLASFMSARLLTLDELMRLSNVERAECERMVGALMDHTLLHLERPQAAATAGVALPPPRRTPPAEPAPAPAAPRPTARSGLLAALRRRLGLTPGR